MTVGGWVLYGFIVFCILLAVAGIFVNVYETATKVASVIVGVVVAVGILCGMLFYFNHTASGKRAFKTQESNFNDGIERTVSVYSMDGKLIQKYDGKFDVDYDDDRIIFDDQDGKRHIIYYPTGTVIIDES